jgi:hypothetical protein
MATAEHLDDLLHGRTHDIQDVTYAELIRHAVGRPHLADADVSLILWECTPYPLLTRPAELRPYLERVRATLDANRPPADPDQRDPLLDHVPGCKAWAGEPCICGPEVG